jgi:hypothetical protein
MMVGDKGGGVYHSLKVYGNNSEWTSINFWPVFPPRPTGLKDPILNFVRYYLTRKLIRRHTYGALLSTFKKQGGHWNSIRSKPSFLKSMHREQIEFILLEVQMITSPLSRQLLHHYIIN